jgi:hypothetical protein
MRRYCEKGSRLIGIRIVWQAAHAYVFFRTGSAYIVTRNTAAGTPTVDGDASLAPFRRRARRRSVATVDVPPSGHARR